MNFSDDTIHHHIFAAFQNADTTQQFPRSFPNPILTVWGTTLAFDAIRVMASAGFSGRSWPGMLGSAVGEEDHHVDTWLWLPCTAGCSFTLFWLLLIHPCIKIHTQTDDFGPVYLAPLVSQFQMIGKVNISSLMD